jgi:hypothetical protein
VIAPRAIAAALALGAGGMMARTAGSTHGFGASAGLASPPFATGAPALAAAVRGGVAVAFADPAGGTHVAVVDGAGRWRPLAHLALSAVGMSACGEELVLGGLRLPDGALVAMGLSGATLAWTALLPSAGHLLHGPFPVCAGRALHFVWVSVDVGGAVTLSASRIAKGAAGPAVAVKLGDRPLELDAAADGDAAVAVWTEGPRLTLRAARVAAGNTPVAQELEGAASPRWVRTRRGLAWVAVGPKGLRARRVNASLTPAGAPVELGDGRAPLFVANGDGRIAVVARGPLTRVSEVAIGDASDVRHEPVYAAGAWVALLDGETLALGPRAPISPAGRYLAGAFLADALLLVHGDAAPALTSLPLR